MGKTSALFVNQDVTKWMPGRPETPDRTGTVSRILRRYISTDGQYWMTAEITLCDSPQAAIDELVHMRQSTQAYYAPETFSGADRIGDACWHTGYQALFYRYGRMLVFVEGEIVRDAKAPFPPAAIEAVAYEILLQAARQPMQIGVLPKNTHFTVGGLPLTAHPPKDGKPAYIPAVVFAKAFGGNAIHPLL